MKAVLVTTALILGGYMIGKFLAIWLWRLAVAFSRTWRDWTPGRIFAWRGSSEWRWWWSFYAPVSDAAYIFWFHIKDTGEGHCRFLSRSEYEERQKLKRAKEEVKP